MIKLIPKPTVGQLYMDLIPKVDVVNPTVNHPILRTMTGAHFTSSHLTRGVQNHEPLLALLGDERQNLKVADILHMLTRKPHYPIRCR